MSLNTSTYMDESVPHYINIEKEFLKAYDDLMPRIYRHVVLKVSNRETAEDITSETFLRVWDIIRQGESIRNMKAFCFHVANNLVIDHYRKKKAQVDIEEIAEIPYDQHIERNTEYSLMSSRLADLPSEYGAVLTYRYLNNMTVDEIAKIMGKSYSNIYVTIHRAKAALKKRYNP